MVLMGLEAVHRIVHWQAHLGTGAEQPPVWMDVHAWPARRLHMDCIMSGDGWRYRQRPLSPSPDDVRNSTC